MTETVAATGQAQADSQGATATAPTGDSGNSVAQVQTTHSGPVAASEETFFDPASIQGNPDLMKAYKQMQGAWTKDRQAWKANEQKIAAYSQFESDPQGTLKRVAAQYGLQIVQPDQSVPEDFNPQSWEEVKKHFFNEFKKEMNPVFNEVKQLKQQNIEQRLDSQYPDWRMHESGMMENLKKHPSLVNDPDMLYDMSVPKEVKEQRAIKAAMAKLKASTEAAQVSGATNGKQVITEPKISGPDAFQQAIDFARKKLSSQGMKRPAN